MLLLMSTYGFSVTLKQNFLNKILIVIVVMKIKKYLKSKIVEFTYSRCLLGCSGRHYKIILWEFKEMSKKEICDKN